MEPGPCASEGNKYEMEFADVPDMEGESSEGTDGYVEDEPGLFVTLFLVVVPFAQDERSPPEIVDGVK